MKSTQATNGTPPFQEQIVASSQRCGEGRPSCKGGDNCHSHVRLRNGIETFRVHQPCLRERLALRYMWSTVFMLLNLIRFRQVELQGRTRGDDVRHAEEKRDF
ncbi:hypothetical protein Plhal304r1_c010g0039701 [Plasmopara halstedii]